MLVCTPGGDFYTPGDGLDPAWFEPEWWNGPYGCDPFGQGCPSGPVEGRTDALPEPGGSGIPPPAPYREDRDYSSGPPNIPNEKLLNRAAYKHDVCYGSQLGQKYCDTRFWKNLREICDSRFNRWYPWEYARWVDCMTSAVIYYNIVLQLGGRYYRPRQSSDEPAGAPW